MKYLAKQDVKTLSAEKIELPKSPQRQVEFLEKDELERLFAAIAGEKDELLRLRDAAILQTLFSTGLRVSELASLRIESINLDRREFTVRGKGGKLRLVFLSDEAAENIKKYLSRRKDNSKALFVGHSEIGQGSPAPEKTGDKAKKIATEQKKIEKEIASQGYKSNKNDKNTKLSGLTVRQIQRIIKNIAGLPESLKKLPHTHLRHSFATDLLQNGRTSAVCKPCLATLLLPPHKSTPTLPTKACAIFIKNS